LVRRRSGGRDVEGKVALVTGAGRGIGLATARALCAAGMKVALGDLDAKIAWAGADRCRGGAAIALPLDVTDPASFATFADTARDRLGPVDVLVNNAGIMQIGRFADEDPACTRRMIEVNVHGVMEGMRLVLPEMIERGSGHVVNLASSASRIAVPGGATYTGAKWFVLGASESIRAELHGTGVDISCILPGMVMTDLTAGLHRPAYVKALQPEDIAAAILATLRRPRFEVWVPRSLGRQAHVNGALPRSTRERLVRALKGDRLLLDHDTEARAAYEERAGRA
jgi:NADP-dependent 3-hydroxy acid dehydrogenase YdfG